MKKLILTPDNPNGTIVDLTAEEISKREQEVSEETTKMNEKIQAREQAIQADATNKANGNQKLLDLGLSQAEATALTGYTPPVAE